MDVMPAPWPQLLEDWMLDRGTLIGGRPVKPMSPASVKNRMKVIKRVAASLGYLGNGSRQIRNLTPQELLDYMEKTFPRQGYEAPNNWNMHIRALKVLGAWLRHDAKGKYGENAWTVEDLEVLRSALEWRPEKTKDPPALSEDLIDRWEKLLEVIKVEDPHIYAFAAWSFFTCMRYDEIRKMDVGLETGSAILQPDGSLEVEGKKRKGDDAFRPVPIRPEARAVLDWWMAYRKKHGMTSQALFPAGQSGVRRGESSSTFNRRLRLLARESGLFRGTCNDRGDEPTGELRLLKSHTIGRHAGATVLAHGKASTKDIQRQTGHRDAKILDRYINIDSTSVARRLQRTRDTWKRDLNGGPVDQGDEPSLKDVLMQLFKDLTPEDKKEIAMTIMKEAMA